MNVTGCVYDARCNYNFKKELKKYYRRGNIPKLQPVVKCDEKRKYQCQQGEQDELKA